MNTSAAGEILKTEPLKFGSLISCVHNGKAGFAVQMGGAWTFRNHPQISTSGIWWRDLKECRLISDGVEL